MKHSFALIALSSILAVACTGKKSSSSSSSSPVNTSTNPITNPALNENATKKSNTKNSADKKSAGTANKKQVSSYNYKCNGHLVSQDGTKRAEESDKSRKITFSASEAPESEILYSNNTHTVALEKGYGRIKITTYKGEDVIGNVTTSLGTKTLELTVITKGIASSVRCDLLEKSKKKAEMNIISNFDCSSTITSTTDKLPSGFNTADYSLIIDETSGYNLQEMIDGEKEELKISSMTGMSHITTNELNNLSVVYGYAGVSMNSSSFEYLLNSDNGMSHVSCKKK